MASAANLSKVTLRGSHEARLVQDGAMAGAGFPERQLRQAPVRSSQGGPVGARDIVVDVAIVQGVGAKQQPMSFIERS